MVDPRFFRRAGPFTLAQLAEIAVAELAESADPAQTVDDVAPLDGAGPRHISFLDNPKYAGDFATTGAAACLVHPRMASKAPAGVALLITKEPYQAYARVAAAFYPRDSLAGEAISPRADVDPSAQLGPDCRVESGAVIAAQARIGAGCHIAANAVIGPNVEIGEDSVIGANAVVSHCRIGKRALIHPGVCIGQDGFGFAMGAAGHVKVPQLGRVIIGDDVEIGANSTIDRGSGRDTVIGDGCKLDNLVQIAHNVVLGRGCVIAGQAGIAGSSHLGDFVVMAGQSAIAGHLKVGSGVQIAGKCGVIQNAAPGQKLAGMPARPLKSWLRETIVLSRMARRTSRES